MCKEANIHVSGCTHMFIARAYDHNTLGITGLGGETVEETGCSKVILQGLSTG